MTGPMKTLLAGTLVSLLLPACAGVQISSSAKEIRTVALVGLTMNARFRDTEFEDRKKGSMLAAPDDPFVLDDAPEARRTLLESARDSYDKAFAGVEKWQFVSFEELSARPAFQAALADPAWASAAAPATGSVETAPGLLPILPEHLASRTVGFRGPGELDLRGKLADLALKLDVDAVAVVWIDMAYTLTKSMDLGYVLGRPDVASHMAVITREKAVVMKAAKTTRFITEPLVLVARDKNLIRAGGEADPAKAAKAYALVIKSSATGLAEDLEKQLSKKN